MEAKDRIVVALDVASLEEARPLVEELAPYVGGFKIGTELTTAVGALQAVRLVHESGGQVFLDLKIHDIPNTAGRTARAAATLAVKMLNVHASAGIEAMMAVVANKGNSLVLAVTILTSLDDDTVQLIYGGPSRAKVLQLARDACLAGADGVICSPQELEMLGTHPELARLLKVTPGVRPEWAAVGDQKRVMTPGEAIKKGATALVIGRPITQPPPSIASPADAARIIADEIDVALATLASS